MSSALQQPYLHDTYLPLMSTHYLSSQAALKCYVCRLSTCPLIMGQNSITCGQMDSEHNNAQEQERARSQCGTIAHIACSVAMCSRSSSLDASFFQGCWTAAYELRYAFAYAELWGSLRIYVYLMKAYRRRVG